MKGLERLGGGTVERRGLWTDQSKGEIMVKK